MSCPPHPLSLSLSKACPSFLSEEEGQGFDKLSLSGIRLGRMGIS